MSILAANLVKRYGRRTVVNKVTLEVHRGEIVGLLGSNGAGKTTTFALIVGLVRAESGMIILDQHDITHLPMYRRGQLGIAYLPQEPSVFRKLTVSENIMAVLRLTGLGPEQCKQRLNSLLAEFHLEHVRNQKGYQISGGERRRTEVARALAGNPSFLLLDEPFAGIDPIAVSEIQQIIASLKQRQLGILITDHNVRETLKITDRAYIMHEGEILVSGSASDVSRNQLARQFYLGSEFQI
ncbi:MAG: LPS export ABC transporter ATP-binding protein [Firmicutes bacterium]|nr:LPS export ABC transporter ATP-binding protein [Bacillota bacterium]NLL87959.1 LPS export ABC transporter ATP-binding protein [Bacillota bacterium]